MESMKCIKNTNKKPILRSKEILLGYVIVGELNYPIKV